MNAKDAKREEVRDHYAQVASAVGQGCAAPAETRTESACCCGNDYLYPEDVKDGLPVAALKASRGCGNPLGEIELQQGMTVLDLGSGGGIDCLIAAQDVGPTGKVYGLDMTDEMLAQGLFAEVEGLLAEGLSAECTAMQAIGYKEAVLALRGEITRDEALELIRQGSRRYAKRQITWFKRWEGALRIFWEREPDFAAALHFSTAFLQSRGYHGDYVSTHAILMTER